jgi:hypothetical protein
MKTELPRVLLEIRYYEAAQRYLRKLPLEHFKEATPQRHSEKSRWKAWTWCNAGDPMSRYSTSCWCSIRCRAAKGPGRSCRTTW